MKVLARGGGLQEASLQQFLMKYLQHEAHLRIGDAFTAAFWLQQAGTDASQPQQASLSSTSLQGALHTQTEHKKRDSWGRHTSANYANSC